MKEKPITVLREEFVQNVVNLVNESELPAFVMLDVLKGIVTEVESLARRQYKEDLAKYSEESIEQ